MYIIYIFLKLVFVSKHVMPWRKMQFPFAWNCGRYIKLETKINIIRKQGFDFHSRCTNFTSVSFKWTRACLLKRCYCLLHIFFCDLTGVSGFFFISMVSVCFQTKPWTSKGIGACVYSAENLHVLTYSIQWLFVHVLFSVWCECTCFNSFLLFLFIFFLYSTNVSLFHLLTCKYFSLLLFSVHGNCIVHQTMVVRWQNLISWHQLHCYVCVDVAWFYFE